MKEPFGNWLEVIELGMEVITDEVAKATRLDANPSVLLVLPVPFAEGNRLCFLMEPVTADVAKENFSSVCLHEMMLEVRLS
ncbi:hypothetical protein Tco_0569762 [Tanacetum coccineum]